MLTAVVDDPQVQRIPVILGKQFFQIPFGLLDTLSACQPPALRQPVDVGVDRKRRHAEGLRHHDGGGLMADSRQSLELLEGMRHGAAMMFDQQLGQPMDRLGLARSEPARTHMGVDLRDGKPDHVMRIVGLRKQTGRLQIHTLVGALSRQQNRNEQRVRTRMIERNRRLRVKLRQPTVDICGAQYGGSQKIRRTEHQSQLSLICRFTASPLQKHSPSYQLTCARYELLAAGGISSTRVRIIGAMPVFEVGGKRTRHMRSREPIEIGCWAASSHWLLSL